MYVHEIIIISLLLSFANLSGQRSHRVHQKELKSLFLSLYHLLLSTLVMHRWYHKMSMEPLMQFPIGPKCVSNNLIQVFSVNIECIHMYMYIPYSGFCL